MDNMTDTFLLLLDDVLRASEHVLVHADPHSSTLARIRRVAAELDDAIDAHWLELAARDAYDDRQLHFDDFFDDYDLPSEEQA